MLDEANLFKDLQLDDWTADNRVNDAAAQLGDKLRQVQRKSITARYKREKFQPL